MKHLEFQSWLNTRLSPKAVNDYLSRCNRIEEKLGINLDSEFEKDKGNYLYSILNESNNAIVSLLSFSATANIQNGMASLKSAVKKYFTFLKSLH